MSQIRADISQSVNNGPFVYQISLDGAVQTAAINVASISAALDAVKQSLAATPGITRVSVTVTTT